VQKNFRAVAGPMNVLSKLAYPFVWTLSGLTNLIFKMFNIKKASDNAVTEEEIKAMISEGSEHGSIEEGEKEIIERVFHLGDRNITSLMTHRTDIVWLDINDTVQDVKINCRILCSALTRFVKDRWMTSKAWCM
jgi:putative hemolysin